MPIKPAVSASAPTFARFVYDMGEYTKWEIARTSIHAAIVASLGPANVAAINATNASGISSLTCKQLVECMAQKSEVTTDEISLVEAALHTPLTYFADFPNFMATLKMNYTFLAKNNYVLPPIMQIRLLTEAIQAFPQFQPYITIYNEKTPMAARTFDAFSQYLSDQFINMPKEAITVVDMRSIPIKGKENPKEKARKGKRK
jgi:hypothetical protein